MSFITTFLVVSFALLLYIIDTNDIHVHVVESFQFQQLSLSTTFRRSNSNTRKPTFLYMAKKKPIANKSSGSSSSKRISSNYSSNSSSSSSKLTNELAKEENVQSQKEQQHEHPNNSNQDKTKDNTSSSSSKKPKEFLKTVSARYVYDNDLYLTTDDEGRVTARPVSSVEGVQDTVLEQSSFTGVATIDSNDDDDILDVNNDDKVNDIKGTNTAKFLIDDNVIIVEEGTKFSSVEEEKNLPPSIIKGRTHIEKDTIDDSQKEQVKTPPPNLNKQERVKISSSLSSSSIKEKIIEPQPTTEEPKRIEIPGINLQKIAKTKPMVEDVPKPTISGGFNVVLTHCTADFDTLASAVGLAKLWSSPMKAGNDNDSESSKAEAATSSSSSDPDSDDNRAFESSSALPTFVVLPRGAHPSVQRFLALHKHLFPIRSLQSLKNDLSKLHRLGLVDAQRRDRVGPAEILIGHADRVTIVDHHIDGTSDIPEATDYIVDHVGSVSTMVVEQLRDYGLELTEAEATLLALGIHADTGSLCFDSTTTRDAQALAWVMEQGTSQAAIAEHAQASLSQEQQGVLTNALINTNSTVVHGVTVSTVLLSADGFINGLAAVTQDALELSSSDVFLLAVVYDPKSGGKGKGKKQMNGLGVRLQSKLLQAEEEKKNIAKRNNFVMEAEAWKGGKEALKLRRLRAAFDNNDIDSSGYLEEGEIFKALVKSGVIASEDAIRSLISQIDTDGDGRIDFDEFVAFSEKAEEMQKQEEELTGKKPCTMIVIGRVKAGVNMKHVNLNRLFQQFGGGGHSKAASCTVRLEDESTAGTILQGIVDELIETGLMQQSTVGDFMTSPVLSAKPTMTEKQVEDLFIRYDVRALPVVDENNDVVGLVTYKEVAAAKQRLWNKEQKRIRQEAKKKATLNKISNGNITVIPENTNEVAKERKLGSALKGWMKQHVKTVEASMTMAEVEQILIENDVGVIPVVADGTTQLVGMVTRTDLLRQHRYYPSLHYINKGFADSIAARKPIIELRKKLKQFDLEEE